MSTNVLPLLEETIFGSASGNYDGSSMDFYGTPNKGVGYYLGQGSIQTVIIQVTGFQGFITIQGTLDNNSDGESWVDVATYGDSTIQTDYHPITVTGNFTWLRVFVTGFDGGTINGVNVIY